MALIRHPETNQALSGYPSPPSLEKQWAQAIEFTGIHLAGVLTGNPTFQLATSAVSLALCGKSIVSMVNILKDTHLYPSRSARHLLNIFLTSSLNHRVDLHDLPEQGKEAVKAYLDGVDLASHLRPMVLPVFPAVVMAGSFLAQQGSLFGTALILSAAVLAVRSSVNQIRNRLNPLRIIEPLTDRISDTLMDLGNRIRSYSAD